MVPGGREGIAMYDYAVSVFDFSYPFIFFSVGRENHLYIQIQLPVLQGTILHFCLLNINSTTYVVT